MSDRKVAGNFQSQSSRQGRQFEAATKAVLLASGWTITAERVVEHGVEIDLIANDPSGVEHWIECKGSWRNGRPGLMRTDTVSKAIGIAAILHERSDGSHPPYILATSHIPREGSRGMENLKTAITAGWIDRVMVVGSLDAELIDNDEEDDE